jgi:hypothetical protein
MLHSMTRINNDVEKTMRSYGWPWEAVPITSCGLERTRELFLMGLHGLHGSKLIPLHGVALGMVYLAYNGIEWV